MCMPLLDFYCFYEVMNFAIPIETITYAKDLPLYVKNLLKLVNCAKSGYDAVEHYFSNYDYTSDESFSGGEDFPTPPYISSQKKMAKEIAKAALPTKTTTKSRSKEPSNVHI